MPIAVFLLAVLNVAIGTQSFVFSGLLTELASELGVSIGTAGSLVPASSVTLAFAAPFATALLSDARRKQVILAGTIALASVNLACAFAPSFAALFALRVAAGIATASVASLATASVAELVPPERRGRAFAIVVGGLTVALVLGVPLGSVVGGAFGWRTTFVYSSIVCVAACSAIAIGLPSFPPVRRERRSPLAILKRPNILPTLMLTLLGFCSAFAVIAFLGPIVTKLTGLSGAGVGAMQSFIGIGSFAGLAIGGWLADRGRTAGGLVGTFAVSAAAAGAWAAALHLKSGTMPSAAVATLILLTSGAMFAAVPMNLARLSFSAGPDTPLALALNNSTVSLGQGLGAAIGGLAADLAGYVWTASAGMAIALLGLALAGLSSRLTPPVYIPGRKRDSKKFEGAS